MIPLFFIFQISIDSFINLDYHLHKVSKVFSCALCITRSQYCLQKSIFQVREFKCQYIVIIFNSVKVSSNFRELFFQVIVTLFTSLFLKLLNSEADKNIRTKINFFLQIIDFIDHIFSFSSISYGINFSLSISFYRKDFKVFQDFSWLLFWYNT